MAWRTVSSVSFAVAAAASVVIALSLAAVIAVSAVVVASRPAEEAAQESWPLAVNDLPAQSVGVEVTGARTDGPLYDLPCNVRQHLVLDQRNREYLLLTTDQGGVYLMPYLDEDGSQAVMPRA